MGAGVPRVVASRARSRIRRLNPIAYVRRKLVDFAVRLLTKPLRGYTLFIPNDIGNLKRFVRKGDVVLVEGDERISEVIKYLTQSSWSHAALYVGDEPLKRDPELKKKLIEEFGDDANALLVEALVERGVVYSPLSNYRDFNLRICRPFNLATTICSMWSTRRCKRSAVATTSSNIFDLVRYFLPVSLVPRRFGARRCGSAAANPPT